MLQEKIRKDRPARRDSAASAHAPGMAGWRRYVVPQHWQHFTQEDHAVWDLLFARQVELLGSRVVAAFLDGIDLLRLSHPGVPELAELNAILEPRTGWRTVAVPGLVPDDIFFAMLTERVFPVGNFIRLRAQLDYLEAPDCFHDLFGHIPMLANHDFAEMVEHVGRLGSAAIAAGQGHKVARIYWHSVEFGLAREGGALKILGAGLASSFGEAHKQQRRVERHRGEAVDGQPRRSVLMEARDHCHPRRETAERVA
jgi:phenylalanine-4-hydroxylase